MSKRRVFQFCQMLNGFLFQVVNDFLMRFVYGFFVYSRVKQMKQLGQRVWKVGTMQEVGVDVVESGVRFQCFSFEECGGFVRGVFVVWYFFFQVQSSSGRRFLCLVFLIFRIDFQIFLIEWFIVLCLSFLRFFRYLFIIC